MQYLLNMLILILLLLILPSLSFAVNQWYRGVAKRVSLQSGDGSFYVEYSNSELDDCAYGRVYFRVSELGMDQVNKAYAIAVMSLTTQRTMGAVIDKDVNGPGGVCNATSGQTADLQ